MNVVPCIAEDKIVKMTTPLELRSAGRPTTFSGKDEDWNDWSFVMRAYLSVIGDDVASLLERVETVKEQVTVAQLEANRPGCTNAVRQVYFQLAMTCRGPALAVVKGVERNNGIEVWRKLFERYEPDLGPRLQTMMARILSPGTFPEETSGFEAALTTWEALVEKWELASATELSETVKVTVIMQRAPERIRGFLQLQGITEYRRLRAILVNYFLTQATYADPMAGVTGADSHTPMQVDALKAKGPGKGKRRQK